MLTNQPTLLEVPQTPTYDWAMMAMGWVYISPLVYHPSDVGEDEDEYANDPTTEDIAAMWKAKRLKTRPRHDLWLKGDYYGEDCILRLGLEQEEFGPCVSMAFTKTMPGDKGKIILDNTCCVDADEAFPVKVENGLITEVRFYDEIAHKHLDFDPNHSTYFDDREVADRTVSHCLATPSFMRSVQQGVNRTLAQPLLGFSERGIIQMREQTRDLLKEIWGFMPPPKRSRYEDFLLVQSPTVNPGIYELRYVESNVTDINSRPRRP